MISLKVLPIKDSAARERLWDVLSQQSDSEKLPVRPAQPLEEAIKVRCGSAPADLVAHVLKLNPGETNTPQEGVREFNFLPCPYWNFGEGGKPPSVRVRKGENFAALVANATGGGGPQTLSQVRRLNPTLKVSSTGTVLEDTALNLPYVVRNLTIPITNSLVAETVASQVIAVLPKQTKEITESFGSVVSSTEYRLIEGDVESEDMKAACKVPEGVDLWPFDVDGILKALYDTRSKLPQPPTRTSLVLLADTGVSLSDADILKGLWRNEFVLNGFPSSGTFKNDMHGASMVTYRGEKSDIEPPSDYKYGTHGSDVARILLEAGRRRQSLQSSVSIAIAKLNDEEPPYRIRTSSVPTAMSYGREIGADALSLSVMIAQAPPDLKNALNTANFVVVAAAGNEGDWLDLRQIFPPGLTTGRENMIVVGAHDWNGELAWFSNKGKLVDIAAPGCGIPVRSSNGVLRLVAGTSFAVPFVTYAVAQLRSVGLPPRPPRTKQRIIAAGRYEDSLAPPITRYGVRLDLERTIRVKDDSVLFKGASSAVYGTLDPTQNLTCILDPVAGVKNYLMGKVLKVINRTETANTIKIWTPGPDGDSINEDSCPTSFGDGLKFQAPGESQMKIYPWSDIVDVVPRVQ
ncbi:S8 family serine peptidase [Variovorax sp. RB2P76]|uniref:S8 family serine peptidase n=1 Tax=Variovorax sp. RB2P76 TaxID=3443736 RepID=UPI003F49A6ED